MVCSVGSSHISSLPAHFAGQGGSGRDGTVGSQPAIGEGYFRFHAHHRIGSGQRRSRSRGTLFLRGATFCGYLVLRESESNMSEMPTYKDPNAALERRVEDLL